MVKFNHSNTLVWALLLPQNLHPMVFPFTLSLPQLSLPPFICFPCCLDRLSGCIRLSKQRCSTVPARYKYLWCVSPVRLTTLFPFFPPVPLRSSLLFFFLLLSVFWDTQEGTQGGSRQQWIKRRSLALEKKNIPRWLPLSPCHNVPLSEVTKVCKFVSSCLRRSRHGLTSEFLHFCGSKRKSKWSQNVTIWKQKSNVYVLWKLKPCQRNFIYVKFIFVSKKNPFQNAMKLMDYKNLFQCFWLFTIQSFATCFHSPGVTRVRVCIGVQGPSPAPV